MYVIAFHVHALSPLVSLIVTPFFGTGLRKLIEIYEFCEQAPVEPGYSLRDLVVFNKYECSFKPRVRSLKPFGLSQNAAAR